jgi:hypothetical protein
VTVLAFRVLDIAPEPYAATPILNARVRIEETTGVTVHAMALRGQVRIDPQRRDYDQEEAVGLGDLFGARERWNTTLKPFLWMHTTAMVRGFTGAIDVDLPLACTYDFEVAATKYLHAVRKGDIPLSLMWSGTVFTRGATDFQVEQIPWNCDVDYQMPTTVWRQAMDIFFPGSAWIRVPRPTLDALQQWKSERGLLTWEAAFAALLDGDAAGLQP